MQTEEDLCPGYRAHHTGTEGLCCCGLYWQDKMPPHDAERRLLPLDRILRRAVERSEADGRRRDQREAFARNNVPAPLSLLQRLTAWR